MILNNLRREVLAILIRRHSEFHYSILINNEYHL